MQDNVVTLLKPKTATEKRTHTVVDTIVITPEMLKKWKSPPFQRPIRENDKVRALAEQLKADGGVIPGVITLGVLQGDTYVIDGQHRLTSFLLSGLKEGYTDIRKHFFTEMADMGEEFVQLNSQLVRMRPDDILRGLEPSTPNLAAIRKACPFVGYDNIRRDSKCSPMVGMATTLRCWFGSGFETPGNYTGGMSTVGMAQGLTEEDVKHCTELLNLAVDAFGRDVENFRLWGGLNMTLCMWLYRNSVMKQYSLKTPKLSNDVFRKCLMSLSADASYVDWLVGRKLGDRDRSPAYSRIKTIFSRRIADDMKIDKGKVYLPQPPWQHSTGHQG